MPEQETPAASASTEASVAPSWWVQLCRLLWRVMVVPWGVILVAVFGGTVANILTTSSVITGSNFPGAHAWQWTGPEMRLREKSSLACPV